MCINQYYLLFSINGMLRAHIPVAVIVSPVKLELQKKVGMGVFRSSKGAISDRWTFSVFPTEGQSVSSGTVKVPDNCNINSTRHFISHV